MAKKDKESVQYWVDNGIDIPNRRLMIDNDIDNILIGKMIRALITMVQLDKEKDIEIYINSFGGCFYNSMALYDMLRLISSNGITIKTTGIGCIMSGGLIIYMAGDERTSLKNATYMAHAVSSEVGGKFEEMLVDIKETKRLQDLMVKILCERTKKSKRFWKREIKYKDRFYTPDTAKKLGIINK